MLLDKAAEIACPLTRITLQVEALPVEAEVQLPFTVEARVSSRLERKVRDLIVDCSSGAPPPPSLL